MADPTEPSLIPLAYASPPPGRPRRPLALLGIAATAALAGPFVGVTTNAVNGWVSQTYFINVMGWHDGSNIWFASVCQGLLEGLVVGIFLSIIFTTSIAIITRATCQYLDGFRCLIWILLAVYCVWIVGGVMGVVIADVFPAWFHNHFRLSPSDHSGLLHFAWVGGSIWGEEPGGLAAAIVGLILFRIKWQRALKEQSGGGY